MPLFVICDQFITPAIHAAGWDKTTQIRREYTLAVIEAGAGLEQALAYAEALDIPFVFSSNGDAFVMHDRVGNGPNAQTERNNERFLQRAPIQVRGC